MNHEKGSYESFFKEYFPILERLTIQVQSNDFQEIMRKESPSSTTDKQITDLYRNAEYLSIQGFSLR